MAISLKAFNVLHYLVIHPDRLITKDTLLDTLWTEMAISDALVRIAIREQRQALGDTAQTPQCIATVHQVIDNCRYRSSYHNQRYSACAWTLSRSRVLSLFAGSS